VSQPAAPARGSTAILAETVLVVLTGLVLTGLEWSSLALSDAVNAIGSLAGTIAYEVLGALIVRRAGGNRVGWFMLAQGTATAIVATGSAYAIYGLKAHPGVLPAAGAVGALSEAVFVLVAMGLAAVFLVFPTGRLPSPRWRPAAVASLVLTGVSLASFVISTRQVALPAVGGISLSYPNPLAVRALRPVAGLGTLNALALVFPLVLGAAVVSLVLRYRRGDQRLRQQLKWLALALAAVLLTQVVAGLAIAFGRAGTLWVSVPFAMTPFLVFLAIQLGLLAEAADDPGLVRQAIPDLKAQLSAALDDLRALARGIYPPLLAESGLVVALRSQVSRSPVPVVLEADQVGRYSQDAESTVYFCTLEALQNVAKHARASRAVIRLAANGTGLEFSVSDDGAGLPVGGPRAGSGLQGMADRLAAHGGTLDVRSQPGQGTTISGRLPVVRTDAVVPVPAGA